MSTVSDIISGVRFELDDSQETRWTDAQILEGIKKSLRRIDNFVIKHGLEFGKSSTTLTVLEDASTVALPSDFKRDIGLYDGTTPLKKLDTDIFERSTGDGWRINGSNVELLEAVTENTSLTFWYYPLTDYSAYTSSSTMPWSGKLDDIVINYASLILKNIDEYSVEIDMALAREIERQLLDVYQPLTPVLQERDGWVS